MLSKKSLYGKDKSPQKNYNEELLNTRLTLRKKSYFKYFAIKRGVIEALPREFEEDPKERHLLKILPNSDILNFLNNYYNQYLNNFTEIYQSISSIEQNFDLNFINDNKLYIILLKILNNILSNKFENNIGDNELLKKIL